MSDLPLPGRFGVATPGYQPVVAPAAPPPGPAPRRRLRTRVVVAVVAGAAVLLAALCWGLYTLGAGSVDRPRTAQLLATSRPIPQGARVVAADLREVTVQLVGTAALQGTPVADEARIVGKVANQTLPPGTLVLPSDVATVGAVPLGDQTVVGLDLKPSQVPTSGLVVGEEVSIVYVPDASDGSSTPMPPQPITTAAVFGIAADQDGTTSCEVVVPNTLAAAIGADSARGDIVLIRLAPGASLP